MQTYTTIILTTIILSIFTACSSEGGGNSTESSTINISTDPYVLPSVTGTFIDDPVQGLEYTCESGDTNRTNENGEYTCKVWDGVSFNIGELQIGRAVAQKEAITPYTLFPNDITAAINLARLLQTLNNKTVDGKIILDEILLAKVAVDVNFSSPDFDLRIEKDLGIQLTSAEEAKLHMDNIIISAGGEVPTEGSHIPVANANEDAEVIASSSVTLDASLSSDADGDSLAYLWTLVSQPQGSQVELSDPRVIRPTFTPILSGVYIFELTVNDGLLTSLSDIVRFTVPVANTPLLEEPLAPTETNSGNFTINEDAEAGTIVGNIEIISIGGSSITSMLITGQGSENFTVSTSGVITVQEGATLNFEIASSYNLSITASNTQGNSNIVNLIVSIGNVLETPILGATNLSINEDAPANTLAGTLIISSTGDSAISLITLTGIGSDLFNISTSGMITLKTNVNLDFETNPQYTLSAIAVNNSGDSNSVVVIISIADIEETIVEEPVVEEPVTYLGVPILSNSTLSVAEDTADLSTFGTITISQTGGSAITNIALSGTGTSNFLVSNTGTVTLSDDSYLDYETTTEYNLTAIATNTNGDSDPVNITINVTDVLEIPISVDNIADRSNNAAPSVSGTVGLGAADVQIQVTNEAGTVIQTHITNTISQSYSFTLDPLVLGNYTVIVRAIDGANTLSITTASDAFYVETRYPICITEPLNSTYSWNSNNYLVVDRTTLLNIISLQMITETVETICTSHITDMSELFYEETTFNTPLNNWDTYNVTNMQSIFFSAQLFNQPLNTWDTSNVTNMINMFLGASDFNQPLNTWDTSSVTSMVYMFQNADVFNQPLNDWNTSNVTDMRFMFRGAGAFNQALNSWDTSSVTDMSAMFRQASSFNQPLTNWNTSSVNNMRNMFKEASAFNQPLNDWNTSIVTDMGFMFETSIVFNQPLNDWNTSIVTDFESMFENAIVFNQDISMWTLIPTSLNSTDFDKNTSVSWQPSSKPNF